MSKNRFQIDMKADKEVLVRTALLTGAAGLAFAQGKMPEPWPWVIAGAAFLIGLAYDLGAFSIKSK